VTNAPGLVGALLVGVQTAKALAWVTELPLVGVHHLEGHLSAIYLEPDPPPMPHLALIVSGGHTTLFLIPAEGSYAVLGRTRDDAAGEAYDKVAKLLGLGYPGGPVIDRLAKSGDPRAAELVFTLPRMDSPNLDFSFSGLKTAVLRYVREKGIAPVVNGGEPDQRIVDLVASFQDKVIRSLLARLRAAVRRHHPRTIILGGGVACNSALRSAVDAECFGGPVYYPSPILTTDNAAMIAAVGYARLARGENHGLDFTASTSMKIENVFLKGYEVPLMARYRV